jgi:hypothetical protein
MVFHIEEQVVAVRADFFLRRNIPGGNIHPSTAVQSSSVSSTLLIRWLRPKPLVSGFFLPDFKCFGPAQPGSLAVR